MSTRARRATHPLLAAFVLLFLIYGWFYTRGLFVLGDAFQSYAYFNYALGSVLGSSEFPQWLPSATLGTPAEPYSLVFLGPFQIATILVGSLVGCHNAWMLFYLSIMMELCAFVVGVYLLARDVFDSRIAVFWTTNTAVFLTYWHLQIFWQHRNVVYLPLLLLFILRFQRTGHLANVLKCGCIAVFTVVGNNVYTAPITALLGLVFYTALCLFSRARPPLDWQSIRDHHSMVAGILFAALAGSSFWLVKDIFAGLIVTATARDPQTGQVPLELFLTYGGLAIEKIPEFVLGFPVSHIETFFYVGTAVVSLMLFAIWHNRTTSFGSVLVLTLFVFLLSLGTHGGVAVLVYKLPFMSSFRHLSFLLPQVRLLCLFLAGFGLDVLAEKISKDGLHDLGCCVVFSAGLFLIPKWALIAAAAPPGLPRFLPEGSLVALVLGLASIAFLRGSHSSRLILLPALVASLELAVSQGNLFFLLRDRVFVENGRFAGDEIDVFTVQSHPFRARRMANPATEPLWRSMVKLAMRQTVNNATLFLLTGVEPCVPIFRVDYATTDVFELLEASSPGSLTMTSRTIDLSLLLSASIWRRALLDPEYRKASACDESKLVLNPDSKTPIDASTGVKRFAANGLIVEVNQLEPQGRLFYSDSFHQGWRASVDGVPATVDLAKKAFKSVAIPLGRHTVELRFYDPLREWMRRLLGIAAMVALAVFLIPELRHRQDRLHHQSDRDEAAW